ncbi:hypothetical protein [Stappia sp. TSB10GB4]|uniref:hypothetical protein n=1 Tax=Stappia sp. TSB10GB4 TaxID=2003584 RepID=UPI001645AF46|nr:hypothetical protein [Stappia sp. TSB10GB4]
MRPRSLLLLGAGFTIWASAFVALYAMLSVGCRFGWHEVALERAGGLSLQRLQLVAIFLVHLAAGAALVALLRRWRGQGFLYPLAYVAAIAALSASVFSFGAVFFLSTCA